MSSVDVQVTLSGPFWKSAPGDVGRMLSGAVQELVEKGEEHLGEMLRPRPAGVYLSVAEAGRGKASTGHYRRNVHGEMRGSLLGRLHDSNVIYGSWLEGTSSRNQTTRFKGYSSFRRTHQWLEGQKERVVQAHVGRWLRRMN